MTKKKSESEIQVERCPRPFAIDLSKGGRTKQSFKNDCDINLITAQYVRTGLLGHVNRRQPMYGDFSQALDLHSSKLLVQRAEEEFAELDSRIRAVADNDPVKFLELLADEEGARDLQAAGLELALPDVEPEVPEVVTPVVTEPVAKEEVQ